MMPEHTIEEMKNSLKCLVMEPDFCEKQESCILCNFYVPCYAQTDTIVDALQYIEYLEDHLRDATKKIEYLEALQHDVTHDSKELIARINAGEDIRTCDYCKKNFGDCSCNCLNDFEWRETCDTKEEI